MATLDPRGHASAKGAAATISARIPSGRSRPTARAAAEARSRSAGAAAARSGDQGTGASGAGGVPGTSTGRRRCQSAARSYAAPARSTSASSKGRQASWKDSGSPALEKPQGSDRAGWPVQLKMLIGLVPPLRAAPPMPALPPAPSTPTAAIKAATSPRESGVDAPEPPLADPAAFTPLLLRPFRDVSAMVQPGFLARPGSGGTGADDPALPIRRRAGRRVQSGPVARRAAPAHRASCASVR